MTLNHKMGLTSTTKCPCHLAAVRALQLGLSSVPRVDPRVPRSLDDYAHIYSEWLLLLRGRLAQAAIELPDFTFDGEEGINRELMRCALCYHLPQVWALGVGFQVVSWCAQDADVHYVQRCIGIFWGDDWIARAGQQADVGCVLKEARVAVCLPCGEAAPQGALLVTLFLHGKQAHTAWQAGTQAKEARTA